MNKVHLSGRLGKDPELKKTANGTSVCSCSIAIDEYKKKDDDNPPPANWQQLQVWNQSAEFLCDNAQKGDKIFIEGRLQNDQWTTPDGKTNFRSYVIVERLEMLPKAEGSKRSDYGGTGTETMPGAKSMPAEQYERRDEDLPF